MAGLCAFVRVLMQVTSCMGTNGDEVTSALEQQQEPCGSYKQPRCCLFTWEDGARVSRGIFKPTKRSPWVWQLVWDCRPGSCHGSGTPRRRWVQVGEGRRGFGDLPGGPVAERLREWLRNRAVRKK